VPDWKCAADKIVSEATFPVRRGTGVNPRSPHIFSVICISNTFPKVCPRTGCAGRAEISHGPAVFFKTLLCLLFSGAGKNVIPARRGCFLYSVFPYLRARKE
jgi:hypothetical protein